MEDQGYRVDAKVHARIVDINGVTYEVEPAWDDVVAALKAEVTRQERAANLPVSCNYKKTEWVADAAQYLQYPLRRTAQPSQQMIRQFGIVQQVTSQYRDRPVPSGPAAASGLHTSHQMQPTRPMHQQSPHPSSRPIPIPLTAPLPLHEPHYPHPPYPPFPVPASTQRSYPELHPAQGLFGQLIPPSTQTAAATEAKKKRRRTSVADNDGNTSRKRATPSTYQGGSMQFLPQSGDGGDGWSVSEMTPPGTGSQPAASPTPPRLYTSEHESEKPHGA